MSTYFRLSNLGDRLAGSSSETPVLQGNMITSTYMSNIINHVDSNPSISQQEVLLNFGGSRSLDESHLNAWKDSRNEMLMMHPNTHSQGLSLSLSTNAQQSVMQIPSIPYQSDNTDFNMSFENEDSYQAKQTRDKESSMLSGLQDGASNIPPYGMTSIGRAVPNSKYLKAAQELLDEVVNVKKAIKGQNGKKESVKEAKEVDGDVRDGCSDPSAASKSSGSLQNELSAAEKQELQNKMTKLLSMLDEVDRKYRQYYHQMQIVVSSFDVIAGSGAAKPYTALALQTISRHFRSLRDAINNHINATRKSLGEEDISSNDKSGVGISRLRYVDQQLRQQRALQHLGMMQQHTWRPQRGLPETSVSILRAWLFEHFLHPYPKDSDKIMLARQTGLTRSQVSNWFINARVRLWKPMVEEMYKEETGDCEIDSNASSEKATTKASKDKGGDPGQGTSTTSTAPVADSKSDQMNDVEMMGSMDQKHSDSTTLFPDESSSCVSERFIADAYHMSELERFGSIGGVGGGVSLTLGLQQGEGGRLALGDSTGDHGFIPMRDSDVYNMGNSAMGNETAEFDCMDSGNRKHQFISSLLPSFT